MLSTQILPLLSSTNSLQIVNPKPVPFSFLVPMVVKLLFLNSLLKFSLEIPTPVSSTQIKALPFWLLLDIVMMSPTLLNLTALVIRF